MNGHRLWVSLTDRGILKSFNLNKTMKKFSLEKLKLTSDEVLQRSQMRKITGGYGGGECCVHYRSTSNNAYLGMNCGFSVSDAQGWYHMSSVSSDGSGWVSGYCCASC